MDDTIHAWILKHRIDSFNAALNDHLVNMQVFTLSPYHQLVNGFFVSSLLLESHGVKILFW